MNDTFMQYEISVSNVVLAIERKWTWKNGREKVATFESTPQDNLLTRFRALAFCSRSSPGFYFFVMVINITIFSAINQQIIILKHFQIFLKIINDLKSLAREPVFVQRWIMRPCIIVCCKIKRLFNVMQTRNLKPNVMNVCRLQLKQHLLSCITTTLLQRFLNECSIFF